MGYIHIYIFLKVNVLKKRIYLISEKFVVGFDEFENYSGRGCRVI